MDKGTVTADKGALRAVDIATVKRLFDRFRNDPTQRFRHKLKVWRAGQIRRILAEPNQIDVETFDREILGGTCSAYLRGRDVTSLVCPPVSLTSEDIRRLERGIDTGQLEYHGNSVWSYGGGTFAAALKDQTEKLALLRQALGILNDDSLAPLQKALRIWEVRYFGPNLSTGLVMLYHPHEFALFNTQSLPGVQKLGFQVGPLRPGELEHFEAVVDSLRRELGAADFLELDEFLEQINRETLPYPPR